MVHIAVDIVPMLQWVHLSLRMSQRRNALEIMPIFQRMYIPL